MYQMRNYRGLVFAFFFFPFFPKKDPVPSCRLPPARLTQTLGCKSSEHPRPGAAGTNPILSKGRQNLGLENSPLALFCGTEEIPLKSIL